MAWKTMNDDQLKRASVQAKKDYHRLKSSYGARDYQTKNVQKIRESINKEAERRGVHVSKERKTSNRSGGLFGGARWI